MPYTVQFIGLVCFVKHRGAVHALLPDGTNPPTGVSKHYAFISVGKCSIDESATSWPAVDRHSDSVQEIFVFPPCQINLEHADTAGRLQTYEQDSRLPRLSLYPNHVKIDPYVAPAIANIPIRQGRLEALRPPRSKDDGTAPLISQLDVDHHGSITITVTPHDLSGQRTILLNAGTEIAFVNMSLDDFRALVDADVANWLRLGDSDAKASEKGGDTRRADVCEGRSNAIDPNASQQNSIPRNVAAAHPLAAILADNHFDLYGTLAVPRVHLGIPGPTPTGMPESSSTHAFFRAGRTIGTTPRCSNTGCC